MITYFYFKRYILFCKRRNCYNEKKVLDEINIHFRKTVLYCIKLKNDTKRINYGKMMIRSVNEAIFGMRGVTIGKHRKIQAVRDQY